MVSNHHNADLFSWSQKSHIQIGGNLCIEPKKGDYELAFTRYTTDSGYTSDSEFTTDSGKRQSDLF